MIQSQFLPTYPNFVKNGWKIAELQAKTRGCPKLEQTLYVKNDYFSLTAFLRDPTQNLCNALKWKISSEVSSTYLKSKNKTYVP